MRLDGQVAVVTGGGQGIGEQIVLRLAREGAIVAIADVDETGARKTAEAIVAQGGREWRVIPADIADEQQVIALMAEALAIAG